MQTWRECNLGDVINLKRGYDLPRQDRMLGSVPIVSSSGVTDYHAEAKVKGPGVVTGRYGTLGEVFYIEEDFWPLNTSLYVQDFKGNDPRFISYFLRQLNFGTRNAAGAVPGVNRNHLHAMKVLVPPLPIQRRVAGILSAYDDLIENNHRRIKILEEMARSLYREWFINFRFPGHEKVPLVDSPLGSIPKGWEVKKLGQLCAVVPGFAFKSQAWQDFGVPVIKIKNIQNDNNVEISDTEFVSEELASRTPAKFVLNNGDFLLAMTGATAGKIGRLRSQRPMLLNQRVAKILPRDGSASFVWCAISSEESKDRFFRLADGAAQPNMSGSQVEGVKLVTPPRDLLNSFSRLTEAMLAQTDSLYLKNLNLRRSRDVLLPRLLSEEIALAL